jgi:hypothetical protein
VSSRDRNLLLALLVVVAVVNLPLLHSSWTGWRVERSGTDVTVPLQGSDVLGDADDPEYWISYRLPEALDPQRGTWPAQVDRATYDRVRAAGEVEVRALAGSPAAARVEGEVPRRTGLVTTLVVDAVLVAIAALVLRARVRPPGPGSPGASRSSP